MDFSLDLAPNSPTHGRLLVVNGDVVMTSDQNPAGSNYVMQAILQRLRLYAGEWFLNRSLGVPYYQSIMVKNPNAAVIDTLLQNVVVATPGVLRLTAWQSTLQRAARVLSVQFSGRALNGPFSYQGPLNTPSAQVAQ